MGEEEQVCYTFEAAIEMAVKMEEEGFRNYFNALRKVKDRAAREILKDAALDELEHKHQLERALIEGEVAGHLLDRPVPTMNLDYVLKKKELGPEADGREALAFAIHLEREALEFYRRMNEGCAGAPMASLFEKIRNDESRHLQALEDLYERHFMPEN
jgi:rubrerythrin